MVAAWGASACRPTHARLEEPPPEVVLHGVRAQHFKGGELTAIGRAARLTYARDSTHFVAYEARMRFRDRDAPTGAKGTVKGTELTAPEVRGILSSKQADGQGGVTLNATGGLVGHTERAHFDGVTMTAAGRLPVRLAGPGYTLDGRDFVFHLRDSMFEFGGATTVFGGAK
jgi:hypothetical protein